MVTDKNFTEGINNLSKEFDKLNPPKKLWYKITSKKSEFQKRMEQPIQKIVDTAVPYFIHKNTEKLKELSKNCKFEKTPELESDKRIAELERKNAELDCQVNRNKYCYSCANATDRCFRNEIGCLCEKYKSYKDENAKLKEENKFLKEQCLILVDGNVCKSTCSEIKKQLTKAKEILEKLLEEEKNNAYWEMNGSDQSSYYEVRKQAEQFLKE